MERNDEARTTHSASSALFCYPWLIDLESTLNSVQGTKALESYLVRSGTLALLEFIWACDGMKSLDTVKNLSVANCKIVLIVEENPEKGDQLVSCIYKNYIITGVLPILSNQVVITIARRLEAYFERPEPNDLCPQHQQYEDVRKLDMKIYDDARTEVESYLRNIIFPEFRQAVDIGNVYVGGRNGDKGGSAVSGSSTGHLASQPEAFAMALCEKLEGLKFQKK